MKGRVCESTSSIRLKANGQHQECFGIDISATYSNSFSLMESQQYCDGWISAENTLLPPHYSMMINITSAENIKERIPVNIANSTTT